MGTRYTTTSASGYNATPPSDDGSSTDANKIKWSTIKTKLSDVLKTFSEAIDTKLVNWADLGPIAKTSAYTVTAAEHLQTIECTGTFTVTLGAAASLGAGFTVTVKNISTGIITVDGNGSELLDASTTIDIAQNQFVILQVNQAADGWLVLTTLTAQFTKGSDVASASTLALGSEGNYFDVTGTTPIAAITYSGAGKLVKLHFDGALTLTHHATNLVLPGGANITTAAGDEAEFIEYASGDWRLTNYSEYAGRRGMTLLDHQTASASSEIDFAISLFSLKITLKKSIFFNASFEDVWV